MLPGPTKHPSTDGPPRDSVEKTGALMAGFLSIVVVAIAILVRRNNEQNTEVVPDTLLSSREARPDAQQPFDIAAKNPGPDLVPSDVSKPSIQSKPVAIDIKSNLVDYGGLLISLLSLAATVFIAIFAYEISLSQAKSQETQSAAATDEVNIRFVSEFRERISELSLPEDPTKPEYEDNLMRKSLATIALAQYGKRVLPVLNMSLKARDPAIREGATVVLAQMLSNRTDQESREFVFSKLLQYFEEDNSSLRVGILKCFVILYKGLSDTEVDRAKVVFKKHVPPDADLSDKLNEQDVLIEAAKFFGNWPSRDSTLFLLDVVKNQSCKDGPREQAINYLHVVANGARDLSVAERAAVIADLRNAMLLPGTSELLKTNISNTISAMEK